MYYLFFLAEVVNDMAEKTKVTYKPNFSYQKNYNTVGNSTYQNIDNDTNDSTLSSDLNQIDIDMLKNNISSVRALVSLIPDRISNICFNVIKGIEYSLPYINNPIDSSNIFDNESSNIDFDNSNKLNNGISNDPKSNLSNGKILNLPSSPLNSDIAYTAKMDINKDTDLVDAFNYTTLTIYNDFINALKDKIATYNMNLMYANSIGNVDNFDTYTTNTNDVKSNLQHLSDNIIRAQIIYDQKTRLINKLFNMDNAIVHFKALYASKKLYDRYKLEEAYYNTKSFKDKFIFDTLQASINSYYNKYCSNVANLYKYYDSCSSLIGDCLNMQSQIFLSRNIIEQS